MKRFLHVFGCALALGAVAGGAACAHHPLEAAAPSVVPATFAVRLHRASRAGDRARIASTVTRRRTTLVEEGDQIVKRDEESREVDLTAALKVTRVDAAGEPLDLELAVESLTVQTPAGRREVIPRGRVVTVARGEAKVRYAAAEPLSPAAETALDAIVSPHEPGVTDDDIFGTREPQAIGGIWPINAALAAKYLGARDLRILPDGVQGQARLIGLAEVSGHTCLDVAAELFLRQAPRPDHDGGAEPLGPSETYEARLTSRRLLPVDAAVPELDATLTIDVELVLTTPLGGGRERRVTTTQHEESRRQLTPLTTASDPSPRTP